MADYRAMEKLIDLALENYKMKKGLLKTKK